MWKLDHKEGWAPKNWNVVLEKTLESSLDCKEIQPVHPKGNQSWVFTGRTDAEVQASILWPPDVKSWPISIFLMLGKIEGRKRRGQKKMRWLNGQLNGLEFEQALGDGEGQGSLPCCTPWGREELDTTQQLNNNKALLCISLCKAQTWWTTTN